MLTNTYRVSSAIATLALLCFLLIIAGEFPSTGYTFNLSSWNLAIILWVAFAVNIFILGQTFYQYITNIIRNDHPVLKYERYMLFAKTIFFSVSFMWILCAIILFKEFFITNVISGQIFLIMMALVFLIYVVLLINYAIRYQKAGEEVKCQISLLN